MGYIMAVICVVLGFLVYVDVIPPGELSDKVILFSLMMLWGNVFLFWSSKQDKK